MTLGASIPPHFAAGGFAQPLCALYRRAPVLTAAKDCLARDTLALRALLERLDEFSLSQRRAITVPLLRRMFEEEGATL